jgi:hypothetical protein
MCVLTNYPTDKNHMHRSQENVCHFLTRVAREICLRHFVEKGPRYLLHILDIYFSMEV